MFGSDDYDDQVVGDFRCDGCGRKLRVRKQDVNSFADRLRYPLCCRTRMRPEYEFETPAHLPS